MVLLTMTPALVQAIEKLQGNSGALSAEGGPAASDAVEEGRTTEPVLLAPEIGKPISHGQIIDISKQMKAQALSSYHLDTLLRGSRIYVPPPPPKKEPTQEYKALMARLRAEQEAREYAAMISPLQPLETFAQRFPNAHAFSSHTATQEEQDEDELVYADVSRQVALIFNVIVSIVCCAGAIWWAAKWWSTPARLALSMSGSLLVAVAEVAVYSGYIRRVGEAKKKELSSREVREVVKTWVIGGELGGELGGEDALAGSELDTGRKQGRGHETDVPETIVDVGKDKDSSNIGLKERKKWKGG